MVVSLISSSTNMHQKEWNCSLTGEGLIRVMLLRVYVIAIMDLYFWFQSIIVHSQLSGDSPEEVNNMK